MTYLMADDRLSEKNLMVMGGSLFLCMLPRVGWCWPGRGECWVDAVDVVDDVVVAAGMALLSLEQCNINVR